MTPPADSPLSSPSPSPPVSERAQIARSAGILALGSIASRVLGLVREVVIADLFGASGLVSAFRIAAQVPTMVYELIVGGLFSAALVPVFSQVAEQKGRAALWALFSRVASLIAILLSAIVLLLELLAPQVAWLMGGGFTPELQAVLVRMIRIVSPAVLLFGLSGVVTGLLYALKRFTFPAFGAAVFNLGTVIAALLLADRIGAYSLAVGVLVGSVLQLLIQTPDLRGVKISFRLDLRHDPAVRRILALYLPIAAGLLVSQLQIVIDRRLASSTGASSLAWMANATTLIQLAHGLVAVAISQAVLPTLSRQSAAGDMDGFRSTLGQGLRLVLVLIVPATLALLALAQPIISLLFEHGRFTAYDTYWTTWALRLYLLGLVFASIDWPLNFAFYARQNTLTPALVGMFSVGVYLVVALSLVGSLGMRGLVLADSAKHISHAVTMLILASRTIGGLGALGLSRTFMKTLLAGGVMAALMAAVVVWIGPLLNDGDLLGKLAIVTIAAGLGGMAYLFLANALGVGEVRLVRDLLSRGTGGRRQAD